MTLTYQLLTSRRSRTDLGVGGSRAARRASGQQINKYHLREHLDGFFFKQICHPARHSPPPAPQRMCGPSNIHGFSWTSFALISKLTIYFLWKGTSPAGSWAESWPLFSFDFSKTYSFVENGTTFQDFLWLDKQFQENISIFFLYKDSVTAWTSPNRKSLHLYVWPLASPGDFPSQAKAFPF